MIIIAVISFLLICAYSLFFGKLAIAIQSKQPKLSAVKPFVSVIVVARNEELYISKLIDSISRQDYCHTDFELFLFDDHSTDQTLAAMSNALSAVDFTWKLFSGNELNILGKKLAVAHLSNLAKGELLLYTDGDVVVPEHWISSTVCSFNQTETQMVCGGVAFVNTESFLEKLVAIEFAAMIQSSLGAISQSFPFMCNAANMAVRKSAFTQLSHQKGASLSSGDDVFLLQSIAQTFSKNAIVANFNSPVLTYSPLNLKDFFNQRIRWAGKSSKSFWINSFFVAFLVFTISVWQISLLASSFIYPNVWICLLAVFGLKWMIDFWILKKYKDNFSLFKGGLSISVLLSLIYPWYVVLVALFSVKRTYLWKGRMVK